jgi:hypothetical protein
MRYVVAVSAVMVAAAASVLGGRPGTAASVFLGAVMVSAWWGGLGLGVITTALAVFVLDVASGAAGALERPEPLALDRASVRT